MRAIMTFMSAMYSWRSGYGRSSSVLLLHTQKRGCIAPNEMWRLPLKMKPKICQNVSLFHDVPCCVDVHDTVDHLTAIALIRRHAGRVLVFIRVLVRSTGRWVHGGICEEAEYHTRVANIWLQEPTRCDSMLRGSVADCSYLNLGVYQDVFYYENSTTGDTTCHVARSLKRLHHTLI